MENTFRPFPILRLPLFALKLISKNWSIYEIIKFSLSTKRCRHVTRLTISKDKYQTDAYFLRCLYVTVRYKNKREHEFVFNREKILKYNRFLDKELSMLDVDKQESKIMFCKKWTEYFCYIFNSKLDHLAISADKILWNLEDMATWFHSLQSSVKWCYFDGFCPAEKFKFFLENFDATDRFIIATSPNKIEKLDYHLGAKEVHLGNSCWFSLENLLKSKNCSRIELRRSRLTCEELNVFLKEWIDGKFPNLNQFSVSIQTPIIFDNLIKGIHFTGIDQSTRHVYIGIDLSKIKLKGGFRIQRNDGKQMSGVVVGDHLYFF